MKAKLTDDELNLMTLAKEYSNEDKARGLLESLLWPDGPVCPHCKNHTEKPIYELKPAKYSSTRRGVRKCGACRKQFTVTVGGVFESSHIPISTWVMALFIICAAKKSVSAHQLHRMLGVPYKTAWFMAHRIRFAMGDANEPKLKGHVEMDETFIGPKKKANEPKDKVLLVALVERDGQARTRIVSSMTTKQAKNIVTGTVDTSAVMHTDEHAAYRGAFKNYAGHKTVNHSKYEYSRTEPDGTKATTNTVEGFFGLFKRGVCGSWHHISHHHLPKYANEFVFRWNNRGASDGKKFQRLAPMIMGKRLTYRQAV